MIIIGIIHKNNNNYMYYNNTIFIMIYWYKYVYIYMILKFQYIIAYIEIMKYFFTFLKIWLINWDILLIVFYH